MATPLIPQEIYLLERYTSLEYFGAVRDAWEVVVKTAEDALAVFMQNLPPDYRSRHLSKQPDRVWGEFVLPRMRNTLTALHTGYIRLSHGNWDVLGGISVGDCQRAINADYPMDWMSEPYYSTYDKYDRLADDYRNISITALGTWKLGSLSTHYTEKDRGLLLAPASWPLYSTNRAVQVRTGEVIPQNGIYLPEVDNSVAIVMVKGRNAYAAYVGRDPKTGHKLSEADTLWTLVERVADTGGGIPLGVNGQVIEESGIKRCEAGQPCPRAGWWWTPANDDSRAYFKLGQVMPDFKSASWATIWQWDQLNQGPDKV
jgi:hypothetical protein